MNILKKYNLINRTTQIDEDKDIEYEVYGLSKEWGGVLFERDINKPNQLLLHVSNKLKVISEYLDGAKEGFFRKGEDKFWLHYRDCDDYEYSDVAVELSNSEIERIVKEYMYLHHPNLAESTCMGWKDTGCLSNPNICEAKVRLDDGKEYFIRKSRGSVSILSHDSSTYSWGSDTLKPLIRFKLSEEMYEKALKLDKLERDIHRFFYGKVSNETFQTYLALREELLNYVNSSIK